MNRGALLSLPFALLFACGTAPGDSRKSVPTITDIAVLQGMREVEETTDRVITQIRDAADQNLRSIGDALAHSHDDRLLRIKTFIDREGRDAASAASVTPSCLETDAPGVLLTPLPDTVLVNTLLLHHGCALSHVRLLEKSDSDAVRRLAQDLMNSYNEDVRLVHKVKGIQ